jgi:hypothetical protein
MGAGLPVVAYYYCLPQLVRGGGYFAVCPPSLLPYLHPVSGTSSSQKVAVGVSRRQTDKKKKKKLLSLLNPLSNLTRLT